MLATVAVGMDQLMREWEQERTKVLHTMRNESFAATIGLSLASAMVTIEVRHK